MNTVRVREAKCPGLFDLRSYHHRRPAMAAVPGWRAEHDCTPSIAWFGRTWASHAEALADAARHEAACSLRRAAEWRQTHPLAVL